jgi:PAS domain S-box-containing protein
MKVMSDIPAVITLDAEGRVLAWNRAMETRYGTGADEAVGQSLFDVFPLVAPEAWGEELHRLLQGETDEFELTGAECRGPGGVRILLHLKASLLRAGGRPVGAVLLVEEISERVSIERSARQAERLAALGTLVTGLTHELNNPIGIISSRIELMLLDAEALPPDTRDDLHVVHRHAQRVTRIAQGLLSFARHSPGQPGPVDLNRLVDETLLLTEKAMVDDGIRLIRRLAPTLPPVWGDGNALQQVVMNLLTNARDALPAGGEILVETTTLQGPAAARLTVRDSGTGIPPEIASRIFDPFFTTKTTGTGLGLSISYGIIRDHQGRVDVESIPGKGTAFVLTFPAAPVSQRA